MGEVHQPMHCADGKLMDGSPDANATRIHVTYKRGHVPGNDSGDPANDNLHFVWDVSLLTWEKRTEEEFVKHLFEDTLDNRNPDDLAKTTSPVLMAQETHTLAVDARVADGTDLDDQYMKEQSEAMDEELLQAGLKLAKIIELAFCPKFCPR